MSRMFRVDTSMADNSLDLKFGECQEYNGVGDARSPLTHPQYVSPVDTAVIPEKTQTFRFRTFNFLHRSSEADTHKIVENSPVSFGVCEIFACCSVAGWCSH